MSANLAFEELNHVALHVADVEQSCAFYTRVLRLEPMPRPSFTFPGAWFRLGKVQELHLIGGRKQPVHSGNRGNHYALLVRDMDAWERHFKDLGQEYLPRRTRPDGAYQIYVTDPDGHVVELCTAPGMAPLAIS
jgi:lactoylglutathione lyase